MVTFAFTGDVMALHKFILYLLHCTFKFNQTSANVQVIVRGIKGEVEITDFSNFRENTHLFNEYNAY